MLKGRNHELAIKVAAPSGLELHLEADPSLGGQAVEVADAPFPIKETHDIRRDERSEAPIGEC